MHHYAEFADLDERYLQQEDVVTDPPARFHKLRASLNANTTQNENTLNFVLQLQ